MSYKASAPGSLMLLGEYAILHGKQALVCAVNKRMTVTLRPRVDNKIQIQSVLGFLETDLKHLKVVSPFQFVLAVLSKYRKHLPSGFDLHIEAEFSDQIGFGSSAAVTVATLSVLYAWLGKTLSAIDSIREARAIVQKVQGLGSGADVAACVLGGMVAYKMQSLSAEKLPHMHPLTVVYSGYKTPTVEAVNQVRQRYLAQPKVFKSLFQAMEFCTAEGIQAVRQQQWKNLGAVMNIQQGLLDALGVNTPLLHAIVDSLRQQPAILGAKISGSGLGDCLVGLGAATLPVWADNKVQTLSVAMTMQGVVCEKI